MNQILGIRAFIPKEGDKKGQELKYHAFFEKGWLADSVFDILQNPMKYVERIPPEDRWNIHYCIANNGAGAREFLSQDVIPFDIDGIDTSIREKYIAVVIDELKIKKWETGIVFSGNGLHFLVGLEKQITDKDFFKKNRHHYKAILSRLNSRLIKEGLKGCADPAVFDHRRMLRLPLTVNRKPKKPEVVCTILQPNIEKIKFDITLISGLPIVKEEDEISKGLMKKYTKVDTNEILKSCEFIKWCKENPGSVNEPQWYALLSIIGRCENGDKLAHEYSEGHHNYSFDETKLKLEQSLEASGPRTCKNISNFWNGCGNCAHFEKVTSPILIVGPDHIKTEFTGFHTLAYKANGDAKLIPNYSDLRRAFERDYKYKNMGGSRMTYIWTGTHYKMISNAEIEHYAQTKFDPYANNNMVSEFKNLVLRTEIKDPEWFKGDPRKLNMKNGILDIDKLTLDPHDSETGFRHTFPYNYDPGAVSPVFDKMLKKLADNDPALENLLEEVLGYALSNDNCWVQKAPVLIGAGANGKSTFLNVLKSLVHSDNYSALTINCLKNEYSRQMLDGKLFNIAEETPTHALIENSLFKMLITGGDIHARAPYKEPYIFRNRAKFLFSCNELPKALDTTHGFFRRLTLIHFSVTFSKADPDYDPYIEDKLLNERAGIFNRAMRGYKRLVSQRGFTEAKQCEENLSNYILENDTVKSFICDYLHIIPTEKMNGEYIPMGDLYDSYKSNTTDGGEKAITKSKFFKKISGLVPGYQERIFAKKFKGLTDNDEPKIKKCLRGVKYGEGINLNEDSSLNKQIKIIN